LSRSGRGERGTRAFLAGRHAETIAALYLRLKGYRILASRYRTAVGEIDLIARKGKAIIFVEVKWRPTLEDGALAIHPRQQDRIRRAAEWYLSHTGRQDISGRFDVVLVVPWRLPRHIKNAW